MADIELVIKIPEEVYKYVQQIGSVNMLDTQQVANAIFDSTPLPKGHGDLIDRNNLRPYQFDRNYIHVDELDDAPTIIEADITEAIQGRK